jgi:hypothetical protein
VEVEPGNAEYSPRRLSNPVYDVRQLHLYDLSRDRGGGGGAAVLPTAAE